MSWYERWIEREADCPNLLAWRMLLEAAPGASLEATLGHVHATIPVEGRHIPVPDPETGVVRVFRAFEVVAPDQVRVAIVGQDPYPDAVLATGVAFATPENVPRSASLSRFFAKIREADRQFERTTNDLTAWIANGVLLLNASLTLSNPRPRDELATWLPVVKATLGALACAATANERRVDFVLLGKLAQRASPRVESDFVKVHMFSHPMARSNASRYFMTSPVFRDVPRFWRSDA